QVVTAQFLATLGNSDLRPERTTEFEGGFDADMLDSRLTLTVSGYRKTTNDALVAIEVAPSVYGTATMMRNIGVVRNMGFEIMAGAQLVRSSPVTWHTQLMISQNRNVVVNLGAGQQPFYSHINGNGVSGTRLAPGYPLFGSWTLPIVGYADGNGNGVLED